MAEVTEVALAVRRHWLSHGLEVLPVEPRELAALHALSPEGIPEEYEEFLRIAGLPDDEDGEGFRFWRPGEIRSTREVLREAGNEWNATEPSLIFADYLQESWWYALWLAGPAKGRVSLAPGSMNSIEPKKLTEFLAAYLRDDENLYRP